MIQPQYVCFLAWFAIFLVRTVAIVRQIGSRKDRALLALIQDSIYLIWNLTWLVEALLGLDIIGYIGGFMLPLAAWCVRISYKRWKNTDDDEDKKKRRYRASSRIKIAKPVTKILWAPA